jgi:hypothetical protein
MNYRLFLLTGLVLGVAAPAAIQTSFAATAPSNASLAGSQGPASNSAGYPTALNSSGALKTTQVGPAVRRRVVKTTPHVVQ